MGLPKANKKIETKTEKQVKFTGEMLTSFRKKYNHTVYSMAKILGVTYQAVNLWEAGEREISGPVAKLISIMDKYPNLQKEVENA